MPPVYKKITPIQVFDGLDPIDFTEFGLCAKYTPNVIDGASGREIFDYMSGDDSPLRDHTYIGNFGRIITPARKVFSSVPERSFYRYKGKNLIPRVSPDYNKIIDQLRNQYLPPEMESNASISNLYRYNGKDCIAPHTDDEKFLGIGNYSEFPDVSTVATFTFLSDPDTPMIYLVGNPETGKGYGVKLRHGSLMFQGNVLHEVPPMYSNILKNRLSITLRQLDDSCPCKKISCPWTSGPSNYLYYTGSYSLEKDQHPVVPIPTPISTPKKRLILIKKSNK